MTAKSVKASHGRKWGLIRLMRPSAASSQTIASVIFTGPIRMPPNTTRRSRSPTSSVQRRSFTVP
jgi:hypothetical protein